MEYRSLGSTMLIYVTRTICHLLQLELDKREMETSDWKEQNVMTLFLFSKIAFLILILFQSRQLLAKMILMNDNSIVFHFPN